MDWELIHQRKQTQINEENIRENIKRFDHEYKVGDKLMVNKNAAIRYETSYKGPFVITQFWTNDKVTINCAAIKIRYNTHHIKPYTYDANVDNINPETNDLQCHIRKVLVTYLCIYISTLGSKYGNWVHM